MTEYKLIRSKRNTIAIEISRDAEIIVRAPLFTPKFKIDGFVQSHEDWIAKHQQIQQQRITRFPPPNEQQLKQLREKAKLVLPEKIRYYSSLMGVTPTRVTVTAAKTRFGSCSGKNSISFSCLLMQYPDEAIDYVVVHELAHIKHHNHSKAFYAEIAKYMPDYKQRQALLKGRVST